MKLVAVSDTHGQHWEIPHIPDGDVLIHAGDSLGQGTLENLEDLNRWLGTLPHRHKIVIAGNHDRAYVDEPEQARAILSNASYLEDSGIEIEGIRFWGSPWVPAFMDTTFMLEPGQPLYERWQLIPDNIDVLITHGPPKGIGDLIANHYKTQNVGCRDLLERIDQLSLQAHIFGHIHEGYGEYQRGQTRLINASTCNVRWRPANPPIITQVTPNRRRDTNARQLPACG